MNIPLSEAGARGGAPVHMRVRLAEVGADVETREGADAGAVASAVAAGAASPVRAVSCEWQ